MTKPRMLKSELRRLRESGRPLIRGNSAKVEAVPTAAKLVAPTFTEEASTRRPGKKRKAQVVNDDEEDQGTRIASNKAIRVAEKPAVPITTGNTDRQQREKKRKAGVLSDDENDEEGEVPSDEVVRTVTEPVAPSSTGKAAKRQARKKRKAEVLSDDDDYEEDEVPPNEESELSDKEHLYSKPTKKDKGKEREHTPEEGSDGVYNGVPDYLDHDNSDKKTVYHYEIWDELVDLASRSGTYVHTPRHFGGTRGQEPADVTSFEQTSASWGETRANRPSILSLWMPPSTWEKSTDTIEALIYNDCIVLDWKGNTIKAFPNLPLTIASTVEGWRVEAWLRTDRMITYQDIVARMRTKDSPKGRVPIYGTRVLASRTSSFRVKAGCISWKQLNDTAQANAIAYMNKIRTPEQRRRNLTVDHDLTKAEKIAYFKINRAKTLASYAAEHAPRPLARSNVAGPSNATSSATPSRSRGIATSFRADNSAAVDSSISIRRSKGRAASNNRREKSVEDEDEEYNDDEEQEDSVNGESEDDGLVDNEAQSCQDVMSANEDKAVLDTSIMEEDDVEASFDSHSSEDHHDEADTSVETDSMMDGEGPEDALDELSGDKVEEEVISDSSSTHAPASVDTDIIEGSEDEVEPSHSFFEDHFAVTDYPSHIHSPDDSPPSEPTYSSEPENPDDARNDTPKDHEEASVLQAALEATRADFIRLIGESPKVMDRTVNYLSQWVMLQYQLRDLFEARGVKDDKTLLFALGEWYGGIKNWKTARPERPARSDRAIQNEGL